MYWLCIFAEELETVLYYAFASEMAASFCMKLRQHVNTHKAVCGICYNNLNFFSPVLS